MVQITEELVRKKAEHNECLISTLEELSLHQEDIERIENLHNWCRDLKILLLQSNLIAKIENLHKLKRLEYLNLALNNIERIENLEQLESLNKIDLTLNFIGELTSIESLRSNYNLHELILTGNPCCDYPNYRQFVIATLPQLQLLDCDEITTTQRLQAQKFVKQYREVIVQKQAEYAIQRDEQRMRVEQQRANLAAQMAEIDDEEQRINLFWNAKSEHCPEIRTDIAKYHKRCRERNETASENEVKSRNRTPILFAPCGRPYNINQAKMPFSFLNENSEYILKLKVYKYLDTDQIKTDIEPNYIRITIKKKIFQIALSEEIKVCDAKIQRSQITGDLVITVPKFYSNATIGQAFRKDKNTKPNANLNKSTTNLTEVVDIRNICQDSSEVPDLI